MGLQCLRWSQGRHNSTISLPNQMYKRTNAPFTGHSRPQLTTTPKRKVSWNAEMTSTKSPSQEDPITSKPGQSKIIEPHWQQFFSDPPHLWDQRSGKTRANFPDLNHTETQEALRMNGRSNPEWVEAQLGTKTAGTAKQSLSYWNNQISKHGKDKNDKMVLEVFQQMGHEDMQADRFTFVAVLKACASLRALEKGRDIHKQIIQAGFQADLFLGTSLFEMYIKCGSIEDAQGIFKSMPRQDVVSWTAMIVGHVKSGQARKGLELYQQMLLTKVVPAPKTYVAVLRACTSMGTLEEGKRAHAQIIQSGCEYDVAIGSGLIHMYSRCGSINDAERVFNKMPSRNVGAWNAMIEAHVKGGQGQKALDLYRQMQVEGVGFVPATFILVLKACAGLGALEEGRLVHAHLTKSAFESSVFVGRSLVDMYSKCGSIEDAEKVFITMPRSNVISWTAMLRGYVKCGEGLKALELYQQMRVKRVALIPATFVGALNACASIGALKEGRGVHAQIVKSGCESDMFVSTSLIDMYSKCGSIVDARAVFSKVRTPSVVSWSAIIQAHERCGEGWAALKLYKKMLDGGVKPFPVTFLAVLKACASVAALDDGRHVHAQIIRNGFESDIYLNSSLIDMYSKCGSMKDALAVFRMMRAPTVVSWNAMISGYVRCGQGRQALDMYNQMQAEGVEPASVTFVAVLSACGSLKALEEGRHVHAQIIQSGFESDVFVGSSLIDMYSDCGSIEDTRAVFNCLHTQNVVCWNAMISGYVKCGQGRKALELYEQMRDKGVEPNRRSFVGVLNACASIGALEEGMHTHKQIIRRGHESDIFVRTSLVDMYSKCGSIKDARRVFDKMHTRSVVSWNAMILGHVNCGEAQEALQLYATMQATGVEPGAFTFVAVLRACATVAALKEGRGVHVQIIESGCESDVSVGNCLVDMYAKCGCIDDALRIFNKILVKDVICWNAMLGGFAMHGRVKEALQHFEIMCKEKVEIDAVTFVSLLSACRHGGLVTEGLLYFESMHSVYGVTPTAEHYACMLDLLDCSGHLHEAEAVIRRMPEPDVTVWRGLLEACRIHGNFELGDRIAELVVELEMSSCRKSMELQESGLQRKCSSDKDGKGC